MYFSLGIFVTCIAGILAVDSSALQANQAVGVGKKGKTYTIPSVVTFKTNADPDDIDARQMDVVQDAFMHSCNEVHPKDELVMIDARIDGANREHGSKNIHGRFMQVDDEWYWIYLWFLQGHIHCDNCNPDDDDALATDVLTKKGGKGHLKQWEKKLCEDLALYDLGFPVYDCGIEVPFEEAKNVAMPLQDIQMGQLDTLAAEYLSPASDELDVAVDKKKGKSYTIPSVVTFKTNADPDGIDARQMDVVQDAFMHSCNEVHPKDELVMIDARIDGANREHATKNLRGRYLQVDDEWYWIYLWFLQGHIHCDNCNPDDDDALATDVLTKKGGKGHLKQWEKKLCEDLALYDLGFPVYDCGIEVPFEIANDPILDHRGIAHTIA